MRRRLRPFIAALAVVAMAIPAAAASDPPSYDYTGPIFGLAARPQGGLLVADTGAGIVKLTKHQGTLQVPLPGVVDVSPTGRSGWALTSDPSYTLYRVRRNHTTRAVANIRHFEETVNPDGGEIDSNPFDVQAISRRRALVADAAANAILIANRHGHVNWVATLPDELAPTAHIKELVGCPDAPDDFAFACDLPDEIPAQPVTTSVAIGPDGAYYVGELKGFPAPLGMSRIWRIERGARHAECGVSPECSIVADGFTSIVDLNFGPDGTLYVTEFDEASWAAVEFGLGMVGGTVSACSGPSWSCDVVADGLTMPIASAVARNGGIYAAVDILIPDGAQVIRLDQPPAP